MGCSSATRLSSSVARAEASCAASPEPLRETQFGRRTRGGVRGGARNTQPLANLISTGLWSVYAADQASPTVSSNETLEAPNNLWSRERHSKWSIACPVKLFGWNHASLLLSWRFGLPPPASSPEIWVVKIQWGKQGSLIIQGQANLQMV